MTDREMMRLLINQVWDLGEVNDFEGINSLLENFPIENNPPAVGLTLLMSTANYPEITYRPIYRQKLRKWYVDIKGEDAAKETVDTID